MAKKTARPRKAAKKPARPTRKRRKARKPAELPAVLQQVLAAAKAAIRSATHAQKFSDLAIDAAVKATAAGHRPAGQPFDVAAWGKAFEAAAVRGADALAAAVAAAPPRFAEGTAIPFTPGAAAPEPLIALETPDGPVTHLRFSAIEAVSEPKPRTSGDLNDGRGSHIMYVTTGNAKAVVIDNVSNRRILGLTGEPAKPKIARPPAESDDEE